MHIFYTPDINSEFYTLNEIESKHCVKVLRLKTMDTIYLIDGRGNFYTAEIVDPNHKKCIIKVNDIKEKYGKRNYNLHIAIAPTKNIDRFEFFLEKATEIGIDEITPILCEHSERKIIKPDRLNKIITSAVKQSITAYHPELNQIVSFKDFINQDITDNKYIAHCEENEKILLRDVYKKNENCIIIVGPEGDFSPDEIKLAKENSYKEISLGHTRLRTETAGIAACHTVSLINQ